MTEGIIDKVFTKWIKDRHCEVYDEIVMFRMSLGTLKELKRELKTEIEKELHLSLTYMEIHKALLGNGDSK